MLCFCCVAGMDRAWIYTENCLSNDFKDGLLGFLEAVDRDRLRREGSGHVPHFSCVKIAKISKALQRSRHI